MATMDATIIGLTTDTTANFWRAGNVVLSLSGPRGGTQGSYSLAPEEAAKLYDRLGKALDPASDLLAALEAIVNGPHGGIGKEKIAAARAAIAKARNKVGAP